MQNQRRPQGSQRGTQQNQHRAPNMPAHRSYRGGRRNFRIRRNRLLGLIAALAAMSLLIAVIAVSCSKSTNEIRRGIDIITDMSSQIQTMHSIVDYTKETDPNGELGNKGWYISKTDWMDSRTENENTYTLEVYTNEKEAKERAEYLETFYGSILADYVVYQYESYVLRVSDDLGSDEAQNYYDVFVSLVRS